MSLMILVTDAGEIVIKHANTWLSRLIGLLDRREISEKEGLLLEPCASVHTIGMRFPIDVIFLDKDNKVLKIKENMGLFRFCFAPNGVVKVLELKKGNVKRTGISLEQTLKFV